MTILIEDSPRNLAVWMTDAIGRNIARGSVITPWATPAVSKSHRRSASEVAAEVARVGGEVWVDPLTHALQMGGVGDFRYYDEFDLWTGPRGDLTTATNRAEHVRKVFELQTSLGATALAPTILLHHGLTQTSQTALELAQEAVAQRPTCWLSIAGTGPFWSSGSALDAHVGALAQLDPAGWFITVARPLSSLPVNAPSDEVAGLCRTVRALSEYAPVHISHGDLAGLPAVAAGASSVGSGWDQRQRVCSFASFAARAPGEGGGGWYERPTFGGLLGSLKRPEAERLNRSDSARATRLGGLPAPGPKEAFLAHLACLDALVASIVSAGDYAARYRALTDAYDAAVAEWPAVVALSGCDLAHGDWIDDLAAGLRLYGASEGW